MDFRIGMPSRKAATTELRERQSPLEAQPGEPKAGSFRLTARETDIVRIRGVTTCHERGRAGLPCPLSGRQGRTSRDLGLRGLSRPHKGRTPPFHLGERTLSDPTPHLRYGQARDLDPLDQALDGDPPP